jgi:hypothetical protein
MSDMHGKAARVAGSKSGDGRMNAECPPRRVNFMRNGANRVTLFQAELFPNSLGKGVFNFVVSGNRCYSAVFWIGV